jgi:sporulation protein YunB
MPYRRRRRPPVLGFYLPRLTRRRKLFLVFLLLLAAVLSMLIPGSRYFRSLTGQMALSDAEDLVTMVINDTVKDVMASGEYDFNWFLTLERDNDGKIAAISTNVGHVNELSSLLLSEVVAASDRGELNLSIPLGNLLGSNVLLGRGPHVPVRVTMLTSSHASFRNDLVSAGINQTKDQIILEMSVDINVLLPWQVLSTKVTKEVLVAETIIVGEVPDSYMNWGA